MIYKVLNVLFDENLQKEMNGYFLNELAKIGNRQKYKKNTLISPDGANCIYIITKGCFKEILINNEGKEISLFRLTPGTIFGEIDYFDGMRTIGLIKVIKDGELSIVFRNKLEKILQENPRLHKYFIHSIVRKYRIIMLKSINLLANNAKGRVAQLLLEIAARLGNDTSKPCIIDFIYTHQELADTMGCSRVTITNVLNEFKSEGSLSYSDKNIKINKPELLRKYFSLFW